VQCSPLARRFFSETARAYSRVGRIQPLLRCERGKDPATTKGKEAHHRRPPAIKAKQATSPASPS